MLNGKFVNEFWIQTEVNKILCKCVDKVFATRKNEEFGGSLAACCAKVKEKVLDPNRKRKLPKVFNMGIDPKIIIKDYKVLRAFSSKKVPLWLMSQNV